MAAITEGLLRNLVRAKERWLTRNPPPADGGTWQSYVQWQFESSARLFAKYPRFDVRDKRVLEIGCGTGGRSAYLASQGARQVIGIDINANEIRVAREVCSSLYPKTQGRLDYVESEQDTPVILEPFDVVVLVDCMEHVISPARMLKLGYEYLRPGGELYFSSVGWYHYSGSHLDLIPFVNVFFSDETIINVERWKLSQPTYVPKRWDSSPPTARWDGVYDLRDRPGEYLNKLTISDMKRLLRYSPFRESQLTVIGFGASYPALKPLDLLSRITGIQEMYHSLAIGHCRR